jgi:hypothetical protein
LGKQEIICDKWLAKLIRDLEGYIDGGDCKEARLATLLIASSSNNVGHMQF